MFLKIVFDPILQLSPICTLRSIIVLCPIKQSLPILTFSPTNTFFPVLTIALKSVSLILIADLSYSSSIEFG